MSSNYRPTKLACYGGYVVQAIVNNFLPILFVVPQTNYKLSYELLGRIVLINFCTQIAADAITPFVTSRFGYRKTAVLSQLLAAGGLIFLAVLPGLLPAPYIGIIVSVVIYALGSGTIKGFAITLGLGVVLTFITAVFLTRLLLNLCCDMYITNTGLYGVKERSVQ